MHKLNVPGPTALALIERDKKVISSSYPRGYPFVMDHGKGVEVCDPDGNRFIDMMGGIAEALTLIKQSLRPLCIDGPNVIIGFTPDGACFMLHDSKKLRPGVVGGIKGKYALMSEECGLDKVIPKRNKSDDIFPMKYDMVMVRPRAEEVKVWNQLQG